MSISCLPLSQGLCYQSRGVPTDFRWEEEITHAYITYMLAQKQTGFTALFKEQERKNSPCLCNLHKSSGLWETLRSHSTQGQGTWDLRAHVFLNHCPLMLMASTNIAETRSAVIRIPQNNPQLHAEWWEEEDRVWRREHPMHLKMTLHPRTWRSLFPEPMCSILTSAHVGVCCMNCVWR